MTQEDSRASRVRLSFERLAKTANSLNLASDRLNKSIENLNEALKKLNLGVSSWVDFSSWEDGPLSEIEQLGYGKWAGKWGILLRKAIYDANLSGDQEDSQDQWAFSDAPREMRIRAIGHLPKLLEQLNSDAENATELVVKRSAEAELFAAEITGLPAVPSLKRLTIRTPTGDKL